MYRAMVHLTPVAIKVLDHEGLQGLKEMHTEMTLLAGLWHPFVVRLLGYSSTSTAAPNEAGARARGCDALVYELMTGGNLEDRLARTVGACMRRDGGWEGWAACDDFITAGWWAGQPRGNAGQMHDTQMWPE